MQEIKLPNLGEGIKHGDVVRVLVAKGDKIRAQQTLIELETDKALIEVPSDLAGTVVDVLVKEGERILVGQVILTLEPEASAEPQPQAASPETHKSESQPRPQAESSSTTKSEPMPQEAPTANGKSEESKAPPPITTPNSAAKPVEQPSAAPNPAALPTLALGSLGPRRQGGVTPAAGPATRRLARELGAEIQRIEGSGRGGRVTREDVLSYVQQAMQHRSGAALAPDAQDLPDFSQWGEVETEPLNAVRRTIAEHLSQTWPAVPLVTQFDYADVTELESLRQRFKADAAERGVHLTLTTLLLKALIAGLMAQPRFNSSLDLSRGQVVLKRYYHIGIAVDTPRGLLVPVLRDVDKKDIWQLSAELEQLAERARKGQVDISELRGASFTLSNQGGIGGTHFTPLVNHPEVAILGVGQSRIEALWDDARAQFKPRLRLPLALSYDHRALDGADAARFISALKRRLEDPARLLLGM